MPVDPPPPLDVGRFPDPVLGIRDPGILKEPRREVQVGPADRVELADGHERDGTDGDEVE